MHGSTNRPYPGNVRSSDPILIERHQRLRRNDLDGHALSPQCFKHSSLISGLHIHCVEIGTALVIVAGLVPNVVDESHAQVPSTDVSAKNRSVGQFSGNFQANGWRRGRDSQNASIYLFVIHFSRFQWGRCPLPCPRYCWSDPDIKEGIGYVLPMHRNQTLSSPCRKLSFCRKGLTAIEQVHGGQLTG